MATSHHLTRVGIPNALGIPNDIVTRSRSLSRHDVGSANIPRVPILI
jgi:hypothetical protein